MKTPAFPAGQSGGGQLAASQTPPLSYRRVPVRALRALPIRVNPRLQVLDYRRTTAPGMAGKTPRTHGHGSARIAGFVLSLCLVRDGAGEWWLEVQPSPYDEALSRRTPVDLAPQILADVYRAVQKRQIGAQGRAYGQGKGRN